VIERFGCSPLFVRLSAMAAAIRPRTAGLKTTDRLQRGRLRRVNVGSSASDAEASVIHSVPPIRRVNGCLERNAG